MPYNFTHSWIQFCLVDETLNNMVDTVCSHSGTVYKFCSFLRVKDLINNTLEARTFHNFGYHLRIRFNISSILLMMILWKGAMV